MLCLPLTRCGGVGGSHCGSCGYASATLRSSRISSSSSARVWMWWQSRPAKTRWTYRLSAPITPTRCIWSCTCASARGRQVAPRPASRSNSSTKILDAYTCMVGADVVLTFSNTYTSARERRSPAARSRVRPAQRAIARRSLPQKSRTTTCAAASSRGPGRTSGRAMMQSAPSGRTGLAPVRARGGGRAAGARSSRGQLAG